VTANSFTTTLGTGAAAIGGLSSLGLRDLLGRDDAGAAGIAGVAALVYLVAGLLATTLQRDRLGPHELQGDVLQALGTVARGFVEGYRHVRSHGQAARGLAAITSQRFFYGLTFIGALLLYTPDGAVHRGLAGLGQVVTASIVGGLVAALVTPAATRALGTQRWVVIVISAAAIVQVAFIPAYTHPMFLLAALGLGFSAQAAKICVDTLVQEAIDDDFRGRVFALYDTLFNVGFVSSAALAALLLPDNGKSYPVLALTVAGSAATALGYGLLCRRPPAPLPA
jgi:hypothetical protein